MGTISLQIPQTGQSDGTEDPKIASNFIALQTLLNGNLDATNLAAGLGPLQEVQATASLTAQAGRRVEFTGTGPATITLPSNPSAGQVVAIYVATAGVSGTAPLTVTAPTGVIGVIGRTSGSSFTLGMPNASVTLVASVTGGWMTVAGGWDTGWVPLTLASGWTTGSTNYVAASRVRGDATTLRGTATNTSGAPDSIVGTIATSIARPAREVIVPIGVASALYPCLIEPTGTIQALGVVVGTGSEVAYDMVSFSAT